MSATQHGMDIPHVVALLGAAVVGVPLFKRLGLGSVLGYLAAGLVIGPFGLGLFSDGHTILHVAELGVVIFLFVIGLEMKPSHLWHLRKQIFGLGSMQVVVAAILLTIVGMLFGFSWQISFISASGFVLTSTAIVMSVLGERGEIDSPGGQKMVSILLFEDLLIVPLLAIVAFLSPTHTESGQPLWQSIGIALGCVVALVAAGRWLLNPLFRLLARSKAREVMTAAALLVVLGAGVLMEKGGLSMAMGAFLAGVMLSESSFRYQLEADVEPFRGLLLGLFFLAVGMSLDLHVVAQNWKLILSGVFALMAAKAVCIYAVARLAKSSHDEALERAVLMAQGGEFAFVLFSSAFSKKVISDTINANMTAIVVLSMVLTPLFMILHGKLPKKAAAARADDAIDEQHSVLQVGLGRFGQIVYYILSSAGYPMTIIDKDEKTVAGMNKYGVKTYFGDASRPELLRTAGIEKASLLVVAIDNPEQAEQIVRFARETSPNIKILARAYDRIHTFKLFQAGADQIVRETFDSGIRAGKRALEMLGQPQETAEKAGDLFFRMDRNGMGKMAVLYNPELHTFENQAMLEEGLRQDRLIAEAVQALLRGEEEIDESV
ncbi:monovalent cation:proton antiporter-2 (CPA2) family protein [Kingella pumchi]|uniref:Monovalent cation:proton antiporter-2 (CPA2) family protein n=1 Tax=Kingella pumchi TaxID=2779506 RepID=A0ABS9NJW8_9NEIS|nr:monovalent cation:proton antiporter-2 (CPA2) family protein [Kingella pumchi]MCG6503083.1 monovalent cation:proton antiporter-2 (CPA2) family protein [Kingella pumchi]